MTASSAPTFAFFTRLLDDSDALTRYRLATEQIMHAERYGFSTAWVAQHHFHPDQGGLPSPFVFLANLAAKTATIRLGTGIVTLPMENPIRVAEDAIVLDLLSDNRLEFGVGPGGTSESFEAFGLDGARRTPIMEDNLAIVRDALRGQPFRGGAVLYPPGQAIGARIWQATFSTHGGARAARAGDGLMLSRTQPRPDGAAGDGGHIPLSDIQTPIVDAYLAALPSGTAPRVLASRSVLVADDRQTALDLALAGARRFLATEARAAAWKDAPVPDTPEALIRALDLHVGTPDDVVRSLSADTVLGRASEIAFQVHPIDPPHAVTLRSIELIARAVAPALGLRPAR
ncbi:putative FMN-dependent luciferase-like monooxygenase [Gluconacetobacter diazotrophicus]|uniref:putative FMN-dependent luciferase-like monooxygenase n=1 Tax=Gluconacetobacter diazotrophicus TaxID=33996 RepID=UPI00119A5FEF|nr:putative FMN-dependent luciferase-like monooxygenase [Gluconacetobacter diazotrophicus]TWB03058.1 putative FMN-dependent luciferase-like monooxygenase [Gluconacetobacter diazotrophicus]